MFAAVYRVLMMHFLYFHCLTTGWLRVDKNCVLGKLTAVCLRFKLSDVKVEFAIFVFNNNNLKNPFEIMLTHMTKTQSNDIE